MRERLTRHWYWILFSSLALVAVVYSFQQRSNQGYWDGAIGNWLATLLGIVAGVPIALAIERRRASREELEQSVRKRQQAIKISFLIRDELVHNSNGLAKRLRDRTKLPLLPFKSDLWRALSDSGEIKWIDNPPVLNDIASAFYYIGVVTAIEENCYEAVRGLNPRYEDGTLVSQRLLEDARYFDGDLSKAITTAIESIENVYRENRDA